MDHFQNSGCFPRQPTCPEALGRHGFVPTPPRTYRRCKRGCSLNDCDSESDGLGNQGPALSGSDEGDAEFQRLRIKRGWSLSKGDDQEAFWLAGPKSEIECQKDLDDGYRRGRNWRCWSFVSCSVVVSQSMKRSHSEASSGLSSPPPSHRKRQLWQFTCRRSWTFCDCWALHHYPRHGQTHEGFKFSNFPIISDSPDNHFYMALGWPCMSPQTPGNTHYEGPSMTYVAFLLPCQCGLIWFLFTSLSCGVHCEYQNPLHNHKENWPLTPLPTSLLPIEYPDYLLAIACRPTVLFPNAPEYILYVQKRDQRLMRVPHRVCEGAKGCH